MTRLLDEGTETPLDGRERAIMEFVVKLTRDPAGLTPADPDISDVIHATAMFAWANYLMQTLGEGEPQGGAGD